MKGLTEVITKAVLVKNTFLLVALLSGLVTAEPYENKSYRFRADYPGKVTYRRGEGVLGKCHAFLTASDSGAEFSCAVAVLDQSRSPRQVAESSRDLEGAKEIESKPTLRQGFPAHYWTGFDGQGRPLSQLVVRGKSRTYSVMVCDFDLARHQKFLASFKILP